MKTILELEEKDIVQALANNFDVDIRNVELIVEERCEGYGPMEHKVHRCQARITVNQEGKHA